MSFLTKTRDSLDAVGPSARRFLFFIILNTVAWQIIAGSVLVLHGRALGLPTSAVGAVMSIMPFMMVLTPFMTPLVNRFGPKRVMTVGWALRSLAALPLAATPWVHGHYGSVAAGWVLFSGVTAFCMIRTISGAGWFTWQRQLVSASASGQFFSLEMVAMQLVNIIVGVAVFFLLGADPALHKFSIASLLGVGAGLLSVWALRRVPMGNAARQTRRRLPLFEMRLVLRDRRFRRYARWVALASGVYVGQTTLLILYMRDFLGIAPGVIMLITAVGALAAMLGGPHLGAMADARGSAPVQFLSGTLCFIALGGFALLAPGPHTVPWSMALYTVSAVGYCGFFAGNKRGMFRRMRSRLASAYSAAWLSTVSLSVGISSLLVGQLLQRGGDAGYRVTCLGFGAIGFAVGLQFLLMRRRNGSGSGLVPTRRTR